MSIFTALFVFMGVYINEFNSYVYCVIGIVAGWSNLFISKQNLEVKAENTSLLAQLDTLKEMYNTEVECNLKQRDKIDALKLEIDEKYQELSLLRQKYSRTNQPRSGGKFVKKDVLAGEKYLCIKDVVMVDYIAFYSGKVYVSQHDRCITNNNNNEWHSMGYDFCKKHFKLINA